MPDASATGLTRNDISEMLDLLSRAVKPTNADGSAGSGAEYGTTELMDLLDKMMYKVPSVGNMVMSPILATVMKTSLSPAIDRAKAMGDWYGEQVERDIDAGRFDRISNLMKMSVLNQLRLSYGKQPYFSSVRDYVVKTYHADITDTEGAFGFIPAKTDDTKVLWHIVETLTNKGLVTVKEDYQLNENVHVAIIMLSRSV